jgi:hypothetical protein
MCGKIFSSKTSAIVFFALISGLTPNLGSSVFRGLCEQISGLGSKSTFSIDSLSDFLFHMEQVCDQTPDLGHGVLGEPTA